MKRSLLAIMSCVLLSSAYLDTNPHNPNNIQNTSVTSKRSVFYNSFFIMQEFCKFYINLHYYFDQEKIKSVKIACNTCNFITSCNHLYLHYIINIEKLKLDILINHMQNSSSEKLQTILLQAHQADSIQCPACKQFNDWHIDTSPYEEQEKKEKEQQQYFKDQCYNVYFMTKEMLKMSLNHQFLDHQKIKESVIYCSHCQHPTDAMWLWISFIFKGNEIEINTLKNLMYSAPAPILTAYLLQKYQEMELRCPHCNTYENYYITHTP